MAGTKSLPRAMSEHLRKELEELIRLKFTGANGKTMPEIPMSKLLGISQAQLNAMRHGKNAGVGALLAISKHTGKSVNDLLGPTAPQPVTYDLDMKLLVQKVSELFRETDKIFSWAPTTKLGRLRAEIQGLIERSAYEWTANKPEGLIDPPEKNHGKRSESDVVPRSKRMAG